MTGRIGSPDNRMYRQMRQLKTRRGRRKAGLFLCEGLRPAGEALKAGVHPRAVILSDEALPEEVLGAREFEDRGIGVYGVDGNLFRELTDAVTPQGLLLLGEIPREAPFEPAGNLLILDRIQDPGNLGTMLRTAAAAGIREVALMKGCADFYSPKVLRSSAGGIFHLNLFHPEDPGEVVEVLKMRGYQLVCGDARGTMDLFGWNPCPPVALVVGNEASGPDPVFLDGADFSVSIPMPGGVESLNAGVAAALMIYELLRKRGSC